MTVANMSQPERVLWAAFPRGSWVDLRPGDPPGSDPENAGLWGPTRTIRAEVIAALLLGACAAEPGFAPAVRVRGARITGRLDLIGAILGCPLVCEDCQFDDELRLVESSARTVHIVSSKLLGFDGTRMRLEGSLNFQSSVFGSAIRFDQSKINGQVCLREVTADAAADGVAVAADGLVVNGDADFVGLVARGSIRLEGAHISGMIDLANAQISAPQKRALAFSNVSIGGRLRCDGMFAEGEFRLHHATVGASLGLVGAKLSAPSGIALNAGGLNIAGGVFCVNGFAAEGEVRFIGARLGANLGLAGATLSNAEGVALNLDRAVMVNCDAAGIRCTGQVSLTGTRIASGFTLSGAQLVNTDDRPALTADGATVEGTLELTHLQARGELNFRTIRIGDRVLLTNSRVENPVGIALRFSRAHIGADMFCDDMSVSGAMKLTGARISGAVSLERVQLLNPAGVALDARFLESGHFALLPEVGIRGTVDLSHARIGLLTDNPACWPTALDLRGLTYQALEPQLPADDRLRWLARHLRGYEPQPYEQLASNYTAIGQSAQARRVLYARERLQRGTKGLLGRAWSLVQDITVGYGYQPWRAALWLTLLLATGSILFHASPPPSMQRGDTPPFNAVIYTLDLMLPIVDLGQKHAYNPVGAEQWFSYVLVAAGWVLATTIAAGIARVIRRN